ncbi:MAG TPA: hypothetical protein VII73_14560 [Caulobacteraceae bacterium]
MAAIHKFSLIYDAAEDRLAWIVEDLEGATTRLWLTARLCRGLVPAVVRLLNKTRADIAAEHETAVQSWEQAAAMTGFGKVPAVRAGALTTTGLVTAAHIRPSVDGMVLTFDFGAGDNRTIALSTTAVRQMLAVMHRVHLAAGWPVDVWPAWIARAAARPPSDVVN